MGNKQNDSSETSNSSDLQATMLSMMKSNPIGNFSEPVLHPNYVQNFKAIKNDISRQFNPFCPLEINMGRLSRDDEWKTCCLISPFIAIASPTIICDENSQYVWEARLSGINQNNESFYIKITDVIIIQEEEICLLILEKPIIKLGWVGLSYLAKKQEVSEKSYYTVNHPRRVLNKQTDTYDYIQKVKKIKYQHEDDYYGLQQQHSGSILFKIIHEKPYVVGIQIHNRRARFFSKAFYEKIVKKIKQFCSDQKKRQILAQIDMQDYQDILTNWNN